MAAQPIADVGYVAILKPDPEVYEPLGVPGYQAILATGGGSSGGGGSTRPTEGMIYPRGQG